MTANLFWQGLLLYFFLFSLVVCFVSLQVLVGGANLFHVGAPGLSLMGIKKPDLPTVRSLSAAVHQWHHVFSSDVLLH